MSDDPGQWAEPPSPPLGMTEGQVTPGGPWADRKDRLRAWAEWVESDSPRLRKVREARAEVDRLRAELDAAGFPTVVIDHGVVHLQWRDGQTSARIERTLLDVMVEDRNRLLGLLGEALDGWEREVDEPHGTVPDVMRARMAEIRREAGLT